MSTEVLKEAARHVREAALAAADPAGAVARNLALTPEGVLACGRQFPLTGRLFLVAAGKAALSMAEAAVGILDGRISTGLVVLPHGYPHGALAGKRISVLESSHPVPDEQGIEAARQVARLVEGMAKEDVCVVLLSGGSSSLLPLPQAPVSLRDKIETTSLLLKSGADIVEINTVRKHLSAMKGGRLAERARGSLVTLAVSDVVGDRLSFIGSGPTVGDPTTFADALAVLDRYGLADAVPASVKGLLADGLAGRAPETPKSLPDRHRACVVASSSLAVDAAAREARAQGFDPLVLTTSLTGEAREVGRMMAAVAREVRSSGRPIPAPACVMAAGETTVTVRGGGKGGRNQEIALCAAIELSGSDGILLCSFATDGKEGNTDAAGGYASGETLAAGTRAGFSAQKCLAENDAHAFLSGAGDLIVTGPTGTNVNDVTFALIEGSRFDPIYKTGAREYHQLVMREDRRGLLPEALRRIADFEGKTVVELGAGTGRLTKILAPMAGPVLAFDREDHMLARAAGYLAAELDGNVRLGLADNNAVPLSPGSADAVIEGWSFGQTVNQAGEGWREAADALLAETMRLLAPGGIAILIETLGTGVRSPHAPGKVLPLFFDYLEREKRFSAEWIRTDYLFESIAKARELVQFFFGQMVEHEVLPSGEVTVPECTGIWWKRKTA